MIHVHNARAIAMRVMEELKPFCERIEIAGSIRREKLLVKDIEIVCIPKKIEKNSDFFRKDKTTDPNFIKAVNKYEKIKGEPFGKYTQRRLPEGINLDLFMANEMNWGLIFAIRTGSAEFSHSLAREWARQGYNSNNGILYKGYEPYYIREEMDLFKLLNLKWVSPHMRISSF